MDSDKTSLPFPDELTDGIQQSVGKEEFRYRNLVEMCTDLIWAVDAQGRWTFLNRQATFMIYGYEPEEMLGKHFTEFEPSERIPNDLETFEKVKAGIPHFKYETVHVRKDGRQVHLSFNAIVRRDSQGQVIGSFGTATDISELKNIQALLQDKSELLAHQQNSLYKLSKMDFADFKIALQTILKTSADFLDIERVSCWFFSENRQEIICEDLYKRSEEKHESGACLKAENYPKYFESLEENLLIACDDAREDLRTREFKDHYLIPLNICSMMDVPIRLAGKIIGVLCHEHLGEKRHWKKEEQDFSTSASSMISIAYLISQLRQTQAELQKKTHALERSNKALEEFAYTASHDLQEPLYIITSFLDTIETNHRSKLEPKVSSLFGRIYNAALRMNQLISDLLHFARINTRKKPFERMDLNEVVNQVWQDLELRTQESKATLKAVKLPALYGDKMQISQLFLNLLSNALKFKRPEVNSEIQVKGKIQNDQLEIIVEDNGIGFESEYAEKIFQPFQRLHSRSEYEGSGMGLAICQKIVERHQGKIQAFSEEGKGAQFVITFPLLKPED